MFIYMIFKDFLYLEYILFIGTFQKVTLHQKPWLEQTQKRQDTIHHLKKKCKGFFKKLWIILNTIIIINNQTECLNCVSVSHFNIMGILIQHSQNYIVLTQGQPLTHVDHQSEAMTDFPYPAIPHQLAEDTHYCTDGRGLMVKR